MVKLPELSRMPELPHKKTDKKPSTAKSRTKRGGRLLYLLIFIALVYITLSLGLTPEQVSLSADEIATEDVYYTGTTMTYTSEIRTAAELNKAAAEVGQVYVIDDTVTTNLLSQLEDYAAAVVRAGSSVGTAADPAGDLRAELPGSYSDDAVYAMLDLQRAEVTTLFTSFKAMVRTVYDQGVTSDETELARQDIALAVNTSSITGNYELFFKCLLEGMELPYNQEYDAVATREAQDEAMAQVLPVQVTVRSGEKLISRGASITEEQMEALQAVGMYRDRANFSPYVGLLLFVSLLLVVLYLYLRQYKRRIFEKRSSLMLLAAVVLFVLVLCKLISLIQFSQDPQVSALIGYLLPVPVASLLLAVLLERDTAVLSTVILSLFVGIIMDGELAYVAMALGGGLTAILTAGRLSQRSQFIGTSMWIILADLVFIGAWGLIKGMAWPLIAIGGLFGVINGLLCAILTMGVLPYLESLFGVTTVIKLLELSNSNHPLLKRLMMEAPGTYNHSILVGNLAEAAADAINADSLLVRVASYYHDIGKLKRPPFYIENQRPGENPHDKLQPGLSAMIITSHTVDGAKMLREYHFPSEIIDIVEQHHGDGLLSYFYNKAKETALDPDEVKDSDYRYKGARPRTKEAALVMLADSVQAAVQALGVTDAATVEARVREVINAKAESGQLQDSPLTFRDLEVIVQSFLMVLSGMNHQRISYPGQESVRAAEETAPAAHEQAETKEGEKSASITDNPY